MRRGVLFVLSASAVFGCADDPAVMQPAGFVIASPEEVVGSLERAYRSRDHEAFLTLLANDSARNAAFRFVLSEPTDDGKHQWDFDTEARVHRRMFKPHAIPPGELPVPHDLWLHEIELTLTRLTESAERLDLYTKDGGADGLLAPEVWRATGALYSTNVFFDMQGEWAPRGSQRDPA